MKKIVIGTVAAVFTSTMALAGDLSEPVITEVDEPEAASSSVGIWPLLLLVGVGILIASQDDNAQPVENS